MVCPGSIVVPSGTRREGDVGTFDVEQGIENQLVQEPLKLPRR